MLLKIDNIAKENLDDVINLCIPIQYREKKCFKEGIRVKRKWSLSMLEKYDSFGKIAYINGKPVGIVQYEPLLKERVIEIRCIFVPEEKYRRRGIGRAMLLNLIDEMRKPKIYFQNNKPYALVTYAFQTSAGYPQHLFYSKMGFKRVVKDDPYLLYYPLKEGYVYRKTKEKYIPQKEDRGKALIFYDPFCPWCMFFVDKMREALREIVPNIAIRIINEFEEKEEVEKRGTIYNCIINGKPIKTFVWDKEKFREEVLNALRNDY